MLLCMVLRGAILGGLLWAAHCWMSDQRQLLRIEQLARELAMSVSALHHDFRAVTALSPLQF